MDPQSYVSAHEMRNAAKDVETDVKGKDVADKPIPRKAKSHRRTQAARKRRRQEGKSAKVQSAVKAKDTDDQAIPKKAKSHRRTQAGRYSMASARRLRFVCMVT